MDQVCTPYPIEVWIDLDYIILRITSIAYSFSWPYSQIPPISQPSANYCTQKNNGLNISLLLCTAAQNDCMSCCGKLQPSEEDSSSANGTRSDPLDTEAAGSAGEGGRLSGSDGGDVAGGGRVGGRSRSRNRSVGGSLRLAVGDLGDGARGHGSHGATALRLPVGDLRDRDGRLRCLRLPVADDGNDSGRGGCLRLPVAHGRDDSSGALGNGAGHHGRGRGVRHHGRGHHGRGHGRRGSGR